MTDEIDAAPASSASVEDDMGLTIHKQYPVL